MPYWIEVASTERFVKRTIAKVYQKVKMEVEDNITSYEKTSCCARTDIFQSCSMGRHKSTKNPLRVMLDMSQIQIQEEESESEECL